MSCAYAMSTRDAGQRTRLWDKASACSSKRRIDASMYALTQYVDVEIHSAEYNVECEDVYKKQALLRIMVHHEIHCNSLHYSNHTTNIHHIPSKHV
jgi:hypothetical protein